MPDLLVYHDIGLAKKKETFHLSRTLVSESTVEILV
jgi:hypothetical protein